MSPGSRAGMDLEEVRGLARSMQRNAQHLDSVRHQLDGTVRSLAWHGPDADALRHTWESGGRQALAGTAADLHRMSAALLAEADQQAAASAEEGGSGYGGGHPAPHRPDPFGALVSGVRHGVDHAVSWATHGLQRGATEVVQLWRRAEEPLPQWVLPTLDGIAGVALTVAEDPGLAGAALVASVAGLPGPSFSQLVARNSLMVANLQGRDLERPVIVTVAPATPSDDVMTRRGAPALMAMVEQAYGAGKDEDHVIVTRLASGRYVVAIQGTEDWGGESTHVFDHGNNLRLMANLPSSATDAVRQAMDKAGIPRDADVTLVGHSQGGMAAVQLANDQRFLDRYHVTHVATFGSPVDGMSVRPGVHVLSVTNGVDAVPNLDLGLRSRDGFESARLSDSADPFNAHLHYQHRLDEQAAGDPAITGFVESMGGVDPTGATQIDATLHRSRTPSLVGAP